MKFKIGERVMVTEPSGYKHTGIITDINSIDVFPYVVLFDDEKTIGILKEHELARYCEPNDILKEIL